MVRISFLCGAHLTEVICAEVLTDWIRALVVIFHTCSVASEVPPPEASNEGCHGHQARPYKRDQLNTLLDKTNLPSQLQCDFVLSSQFVTHGLPQIPPFGHPKR